MAHFGGSPAGQGQHRLQHVDAGDPAGFSHQPGGDEAFHPAAAAEIDHPLPRPDPGVHDRTAAAVAAKAIGGRDMFDQLRLIMDRIEDFAVLVGDGRGVVGADPAPTVVGVVRGQQAIAVAQGHRSVGGAAGQQFAHLQAQRRTRRGGQAFGGPPDQLQGQFFQQRLIGVVAEKGAPAMIGMIEIPSAQHQTPGLGQRGHAGRADFL